MELSTESHFDNELRRKANQTAERIAAVEAASRAYSASVLEWCRIETARKARAEEVLRADPEYVRLVNESQEAANRSAAAANAKNAAVAARWSTK